MRIDLMSGGRRPWPLKLALKALARYVGMAPGPLVTLSYRPDLFSRALQSYILRGVGVSSAWTRGESELFASFVSKLNRCSF
jgi:hypothetical protein